MLDHLVRLGITTIEFMPVWAFLDELRLVGLGLRNYWGYNPYSFMAPDPRFAVADPTAEFRAMVEALHGAGIEVVLDVVLNHTAETDLLGRHCRCAASTTPPTIGSIRRTQAAIWTGPAAATA